MLFFDSRCAHSNSVRKNVNGTVIKLSRGKHYFFVFYKEPVKKNLSSRDLVYYSLNISFVVGIIDPKIEKAYGICFFDTLTRLAFIVLTFSGLLIVAESIIIALFWTALIYAILLFIGKKDDKNTRRIITAFLEKGG